MRYIHDKCRLEWAKRADKFMDASKNVYMYCDICKMKIFILIEKVCRLKGREELCLDIRSMICQLLVLLLIMATLLTSLIVSITNVDTSQPDQLLLIAVAAVSGFLLALCLILLFFRLFSKLKHEITGFSPAGSHMINISRVSNSQHL